MQYLRQLKTLTGKFLFLRILLIYLLLPLGHNIVDFDGHVTRSNQQQAIESKDLHEMEGFPNFQEANAEIHLGGFLNLHYIPLAALFNIQWNESQVIFLKMMSYFFIDIPPPALA